MSTPTEFKRALDLVVNNVVDLKPLITLKLPLVDGVKGFAEAQSFSNLRVMLNP
ncbi:MAG: hypothetical protein QXY84_02810 [Candidatus Caldarchaeum sp.]